jgi:peptide/nickel transport system permease protein
VQIVVRGYEVTDVQGQPEIDDQAVQRTHVEGVDDQVSLKQMGQGALFWRRFRRHRVALVGGVMLFIIVCFAIVGPYITPENPMIWNFNARNWGPQGNFRYLFGATTQGHSVMMNVLLGAHASLEVGFLGAGLASAIGIVLGAVAGYFGGFVDAVLMRLTDVFLTLPFLPVLIVSEAFLAKGGIGFIIVIFAFLGWSGVARLIRAYYLTFREQEFVEAARAVGVSSPRIIFRHIMPNSLSPIIVSFTLGVAGFISAEAAVDYLGYGLRAPDISWGLALANAEDSFIQGNWWSAIFPGVALVLTVLSINFLGDGLRDALDVKSKLVE